MSEKKRWYQGLVKESDRRIVLICVGIALILWLTTKLSQNYTHDYSFTLLYDLPENVSFTRIPQSGFEAKLSGQGWELLQASVRRGFSKVHVPVRRGDITRTDLVQALYQHLGDSEVQVREVNIDVIPIDTDITMRKSVPIRYAGSIKFADGLQYRDSLIIEPSTAILTGPASLCENIAAIELTDEEIPVLSADFSKTVEVPSPNALITVSPSQAELIIQADPIVKLDFMVPLQIEGDTAGMALNAQSVRIRCSIGQSKQEKTSPGLFSAVASVDEECLAANRCPIDVKAPAFASDVTAEPAFLELSASETPEDQ